MGPTADHWARAICAAAEVYGDDPRIALTCASRIGARERRAIPAAASAMRDVFGLTSREASGAVQLSDNVLRVARAKRRGRFNDAEAAARAAIGAQTWRPAPAALGRWRLCDPSAMLSPRQPPKPYLRPHKRAKAALAADQPAAAQGPVDVVEAGGEAPPGMALAPEPRQIEPRPAASAPVYRPGPASPARPAYEIRRPAPAAPADSLEARILAHLRAHAYGTTAALATILDAKESAVAAALRNLAYECKARADELDEAGLRGQKWRLAK